MQENKKSDLGANPLATLVAAASAHSVKNDISSDHESHENGDDSQAEDDSSQGSEDEDSCANADEKIESLFISWRKDADEFSNPKKRGRSSPQQTTFVPNPPPPPPLPPPPPRRAIESSARSYPAPTAQVYGSVVPYSVPHVPSAPTPANSQHTYGYFRSQDHRSHHMSRHLSHPVPYSSMPPPAMPQKRIRLDRVRQPAPSDASMARSVPRPSMSQYMHLSQVQIQPHRVQTMQMSGVAQAPRTQIVAQVPLGVPSATRIPHVKAAHQAGPPASVPALTLPQHSEDRKNEAPEVMVTLERFDVVCGRSTKVTELHEGNVRFRETIDRYRQQYRNTRKRAAKQVVLDQVMREVQSWRPGGRFLVAAERDAALATTKAFVLAKSEVAEEKVRKALRRDMEKIEAEKTRLRAYPKSYPEP
eukprot:CAMPEP_0116565042 /NCGR_PEP_ID=MMETSP0397-20121206/13680_1 /TAXON_ID=216820 /ORGANISM="Cyclophora tenuis, Strain ECT3854" /LENGTH=417 /DNA_ID=CAMNT_0004091775 /DNA_START=110 /DNA_END=1363 /DNA_ORIENTATION=-